MPTHNGKNNNNPGTAPYSESPSAAPNTQTSTEVTPPGGDQSQVYGEMAATSSLDSLILEGTQWRVIDRTIGAPNDYVELHIYNTSNQLIASIPDFRDFEADSAEVLSNSLIFDPKNILLNLGYSTGKFSLKYLIFHNFSSKTLAKFITDFALGWFGNCVWSIAAIPVLTLKNQYASDVRLITHFAAHNKKIMKTHTQNACETRARREFQQNIVFVRFG